MCKVCKVSGWWTVGVSDLSSLSSRWTDGCYGKVQLMRSGPTKRFPCPETRYDHHIVASEFVSGDVVRYCKYRLRNRRRIYTQEKRRR